MTTATSASIGTAGGGDKERAVATLVTAFASDRIVRWALPEPHEFLTHFPELVRRFGTHAWESESGYVMGPFDGVALWLRPGVDPDNDGIGELMQQVIPEADQEKVFGFFGQMAEYHPHEPLWYLPFIGIDPSHQGQGLGSALLSHVLKEVDRDGQAAYLEATTERSRDLYTRHGFEVLGAIQVADSPTMYPMLRTAR
jgi:ribosomal protein S18 acetylase RimI-like enzyme